MSLSHAKWWASSGRVPAQKPAALELERGRGLNWRHMAAHEFAPECSHRNGLPLDRAGELWQGRETGADDRENQPADACGDDRNDPVPREFLHEQISKTGIH